MTSTNPRAMYCGQKCKKDAHHARQSGLPVRKVTTTGITRPSAAQELAELSPEERVRLADRFTLEEEATWRRWIPEPFRPDDLRCTPLQLMGRYGPSCDIAELGFERGSAIAEFIELGPEGFAKAKKRARKRVKSPV